MSTNHRITIIGSDDRCQARCSCKQKSTITDRGGVEAWQYLHLQEIERIRAHLGSRNPSIRSQLAWFETQAANLDNDPDDRALWHQLADETKRYMNSRVAGPMPGEQTLF